MEKIIIDSDTSLEESLVGLEIPEEIKIYLTLINVKYIGFLWIIDLFFLY